MLKKERQQKILDIIKEKQYASVSTLSKLLYASLPTIRRDLTELQKNGLITRSHGGAMILSDGSYQIPLDFRIGRNTHEKIEIIEPLRDLFKDEVRQLGIELGIPEQLVWRQPFPGPGLAVRVIGAITREKLEILRNADAIFREEVANAGLGRELNQYFAVITDMRSVGVMGDGRTYDYTLALRAVNTTDFMTADWARIPYDVLERCSNRIVNEVEHVNRLVYDITSKPPATIEWE